MAEGEPVSEPFDPRRGWPPYAASAVAAWSAIAAGWPLFDDFLPWFGPAMVLGVAVGVPVSLFLRSRRFHQYRVNLVVFGIAGILAAMLATQLADTLAAARSPNPMFMFASARLPAALLLHLFAWVTAFHAFTLVTEGELLLTILPGMSILLVTAVMVGGRAPQVWTLVFGVAAAVLFANDAEHGLIAHVARRHVPGEMRRRSRAALRGVVVFGAALPLILALAWAGPRVDPVRQAFREAQSWTDELLGHWLIRMWTAVRPTEAEVALSVELGGQAATGSREVFRVQTPRFALYRGAAYDRYEQNAWTLDRRDLRLAELSPDGYRLAIRDPGRAAGITSLPMEQTFRVSAGFSAILYAAYEPETVMASVRRLRSYSGSALATASDLGPGSTYTVISRRKEPVDQADRVNAHLGEADRERYLQLPESIPPGGRVRRLAGKITAGTRDPYEKARAISDYLESNYRYLARITPPPPQAEGVEHFLFSTKGAYCDYFASALVVMCRAAGVPARLVTGYRTDDVPERDGWFVARQRNAHSWADAFVDGYGWTELDPSPIAEEKTALQRAGEEMAKANQAIKRALLWPVRWIARVEGAWWKAPIAVACLISLVRGLYIILREKPVGPPLPGAGSEVTVAYLVTAYRQMRRWLEKWGYRKAPGDTAREYAAAVAGIALHGPREAGGALRAVEAIVAAYTAARYAGVAGAAHAQEAAEALAALLAARGTLRKAALRWAQGRPAPGGRGRPAAKQAAGEA
jgi:transglutaminase-like putative cysteine protease